MRTWTIGFLLALFCGVAAAQQAPQVVRASVLSMSAKGAETEIEVSAGASQGVAPGWKGTIKGLPRQVVLVTCRVNSCVGRIPMPFKQIKRTIQRNKDIVLRP